MHIAILGGTGDVGEGLALRLGCDTSHEITIGSRDQERAETSAASYRERIGGEPRINGVENTDAATSADVVVVAVPPYYVGDTIDAIAPVLNDGHVLVSPAVGMTRDDRGFSYKPPAVGSVGELAADTAPDGVPVIGAFQNLAAGALSDLDRDLDLDVVVTGDNSDAKRVVLNLVADIDGLCPLDGGGLSNSAEVESITPLLINLAMNNDGMSDLGVRFG